MDYPDLKNYRKLYARYLSGNGRSVNELLDLAEGVLGYQGTRVLDLCGGGGELSLAARERGAEYVLLVDECKDMVDFENVVDYKTIDYCCDDIQVWLDGKWEEEPFDYVFCRQGVNYWLCEDLVENLAGMVKPGGAFVFNTFNKKPSTKPTVKQYAFNGLEYFEVSWLNAFNGLVHHIQCCEGICPHETFFYWIEPERFRELLEPWFNVDALVDGATTLYYCKRKTG